jgi:hypothetical protein
MKRRWTLLTLTTLAAVALISAVSTAPSPVLAEGATQISGVALFGQHPIVEGSGTGILEGVTGRLYFKDDVEAGTFPYRGHLQF